MRTHFVSAAFVIAAASIGAACGAGTAEPAAAPAPVTAGLPAEVESRVDSIARATLERGMVPGLTIAVARGGEPVFARGYGRADRQSGAAPDPTTVFRTGSVTKQFTAAAILRLAEQGRVDLDAPITRYLPDYPQPEHTVTVRHLLNHTSGIPSYTGMARWRARLHEPLTHDEMLAFWTGEPLEFAPGAQWRYNNSGYYLLGLIIERVTGEDYPTHVREQFVRPLGLEATGYCPDEPEAGHARGHTAGAGGIGPSIPISMTSPFAAGALCSSVVDLVRWKHALAGGRVVSPASWERMTTPDTLKTGRAITYGFGLGVDRWEGERRIHHGGGIPGFSAFLSHYPEHDLTIAVLQNSDAHNAQLTEEAIARAVLGIRAPEVRDLTLTAAERARYVGTYDLGPMQLRVFEQDGRLVTQATNQGAVGLLAQGNHEFRAAFDTSVRLVFDVQGERAASLTLYQGGAVMPARRIDP